jgi:hypothetical protein
MVDTLFSLAESHLFMQLVELAVSEKTRGSRCEVHAQLL